MDKYHMQYHNYQQLILVTPHMGGLYVLPRFWIFFQWRIQRKLLDITDTSRSERIEMTQKSYDVVRFNNVAPFEFFQYLFFSDYFPIFVFVVSFYACTS